jgi:DEAD/DEAH box helicase domain-containing protein
VSAPSTPTSALYKLLDGLARRHRQVVWVQTLPSRPAQFAEPAAPLSTAVSAALQSFGVERLYTHQARALDRARAGEHTVVVTGTASGKTLCYNLPVLETLYRDPGARALYLFPTKALAQDQLKGLKRFLGEEGDEGAESSDEARGGSGNGGGPRPARRPGAAERDRAAAGAGEEGAGLFFRAGTYDGDTPPNLRRRLRDEANILLTNPDMLHSGILPHHARWAEFFARLQYVVIDEIHVYRGIFGSHVANVLHRLRRICRHHGSDPVFLCASATIANPRELAERLTGLPFAVVDEDGAPRGTKHFFFWNPPRLGPAGMERRSANAEAREILVRLVRDGYQAIVFVKTRAMTEVLLRDIRGELREDGGGLAKKVRSYRAGYLPEERRKIEAALFNNELLGVISTNALELGIDVGSLDAAVIVGYPGTIASTWQQAGRAGRRESESAAVLIGHNAPIDQYLMTNPAYFFERSPEHAVLDRGNPHILLSHLRCAAFEIPLSRKEEPEFGGLTPGILDLLEEHKHVREIRGRWYYTREDYPAATVSLRNASQNAYTILDASASRDGGEEQGKNRVLGTVDEGSAFWQVHPQAVYMHDGETYFVDKLDLGERTAYVHKADLDYYTQAVSDTRVDAAEADLEKTWRRAELCFGPCSVLDKLTMFKKIRFGGRDSLGFGQVSLPHTTLQTTGLWLRPHADALEKVVRWGRVPADGLQGIANVLSYTVSLHAMCDPLDIGTAVDMRAVTGPVLYLYDKYPGGLGYAQRAWHLIEEVMRDALALIRRCECDDGCPSCVGSPLLPQYQQDPDAEMKGRIPDKDAALILLHALLEEPDYEPKMPLTGTALARAQRILAAAAGAREADGAGGQGDEADAGGAGAATKRRRRRTIGGAGEGDSDGAGGSDRERGFGDDGGSGDESDSVGEGSKGGTKRRPLPPRVRVKLPDDLRVKLEEQLRRIEESPPRSTATMHRHDAP